MPSPGDLPDPGTDAGVLHCRQILHHLSHRGETEAQLGTGPLPQVTAGKEQSLEPNTHLSQPQSPHAGPLAGNHRGGDLLSTAVCPGTSRLPSLSLRLPREVATEGAWGHQELTGSEIPGAELGRPARGGPPRLAQTTSPEDPIRTALDQAISGNKAVRELASLALFIVWELGIF